MNYDAVRILLAAGLCLLCPPALADLELVLKVEVEQQTAGGKPQRQEYTTETFFRKEMMASRQAGGGWRIIRFDRKLIWDVAAGGKSYVETTFEELRRQQERARAQSRARRERQKKQLASLLANPGLPAEQRARLRSLLEPVVYKVEGGAKEQVAGHACTRYTIRRNGERQMQVWACATLAPEIDFNRIQSLSSAGDERLQREMEQIRGVWVKWVIERKGTATATRLATAPLDPRIFELPAGAVRRQG